VVLIGAGPTARQSYFPALQQLQQENALIVRAIVQATTSGLEAIQNAFPGIRCVSTMDAAAIQPDALAIIATPTRFHFAQVHAALKRGWHVLCASPLATNATEAALMIAAAQRHERFLAVDLRTRFFPGARYLRTLCHDQLLGPPINLRVQLGPPRPLADAEFRAGKLVHVESVLPALGSAGLDLLTWCLGSARLVSYADDAMGGVEATAAVRLSFRDEVRGILHLSQEWSGADSYEFVFERGIARWTTNRGGTLVLQLASAPFALVGELAMPLSVVPSPRFDTPLATDLAASVEQLENVIAAIAGRCALRTPALEVLPVIALIDECFARRTPLAQPWLSRNDAAHARALAPPPPLSRP
jgi:predicted dehydrogenase